QTAAGFVYETANERTLWARRPRQSSRIGAKAQRSRAGVCTCSWKPAIPSSSPKGLPGARPTSIAPSSSWVRAATPRRQSRSSCNPAHSRRARRAYDPGVKVEAIQYGDRKVYSVASFNRGVADWLSRLPTIWVEGEVTELRRNVRWQSVFFTLKDPSDGACLGVTIARSRFDALRLDLAEGERVHVFGRPELFEAKGDFRMRVLSIERFGLGDHLAALERLKKKLAAEGVLVRAVASSPVPVVSAVGHEQDTPLCDLAADARASTPTAAARLVVPDSAEVLQRLDRARGALARGARVVVERRRQRVEHTHERLRRAPALAVERKRARLEHCAGRLRALSPRATLQRGYAIVRSDDEIVRSADAVASGETIDVEVADGRFGARVE